MKTVLKHEAATLPRVIGILCPTCGADDWALAAKSVQPKDESKVKLRCSACEAQRVKPDELLSDVGLQRRAIRFYERQTLSLALKVGKALDFLYQYNFINVSPSSALVLLDCFETLVGSREDDECGFGALESAHARVDAVVKLIDSITEVADFDSWGSQPMRDEEDDEAIMDFRGSKPRHITLEDVRESLRVTVASKGGV